MSIEEALAARQIEQMIRQGWQRQAIINATWRMLRSQGFGEKHSREVAAKMYDLVA